MEEEDEPANAERGRRFDGSEVEAAPCSGVFDNGDAAADDDDDNAAV
jgi:hypothetical protein